LVVTPWYCAVGHVVGHGAFRSFQRRGSTDSRPMVDWWMDVVLRIPIGKKTHESSEVGRTDVKELGSREGRLLVVLGRKPVLKFHKAACVGVVAVLVGHRPAGGIIIVE